MDRFTADGKRKHAKAVEERIRRELQEEYAVRLAAAGRWRAFWLRRELEREIRRRMREEIPGDALYWKA